VGAVQGEVFALSSALSLHQALEFPQRVVRSWISAHRRGASFSSAFSTESLGVSAMVKPSYPSDKVQTIGGSPTSRNRGQKLPRQSCPDSLKNFLYWARGLLLKVRPQATVDLDQHQLRSGDLFYAQCPLRDRMTVSSTRRRNIFERPSDCRRRPCITLPRFDKL